MTLAVQSFATLIDWLLGSVKTWAFAVLVICIVVTVIRGIVGKFTITRWLTLAVEVILAVLIANYSGTFADTIKSDIDTHTNSMPAARVVEWPEAT
jgi:hypothetical protein